MSNPAPSSDDMSVLAGKGNPFPFEGRTYDVAPLDGHGEAAFERWLKEGDVRAAQELKIISADAYREAIAKITDNIRNKAYVRGGEAFARAIYSFTGLIEMAYLMMSRHDRDKATGDRVSRELVERMMLEDGETLGQLIGLALQDPNRQAPAK